MKELLIYGFIIGVIFLGLLFWGVIAAGHRQDELDEEYYQNQLKKKHIDRMNP